MLCFGFDPWTAGLEAQTNPLSYGGPLRITTFENAMMMDRFGRGLFH